ncbi:MMPL family transporter [Thalassobacillus devorans]|uniref:MMPL family transporter n=1 Tax=Thalassobacillus devorans TaxID=279813 RepID=UPI000A1CAD1F|nr:MMPL family transporter [Thalassobacillus devorans]
MKVFNFLTRVLARHPMRVIFIALLIIVLMAAGARNVHMATGNETLVQTDTEVYQDNQKLEEEFGGESITVLYEGEDLLTPENLQHMKGLEDQLEDNNAVFSVFSPVTLVEQIAEKQQEKSMEGIGEINEGLKEMGRQLKESGEHMEAGSDQQTKQLEGFQTQQEQQKKEMDKLGEHLLSISDNVETVTAYSDTMKSGLPEKQATLDHLIYDDDHQLRTSFEEVVLDNKYMLMIIKFEGNVEDSVKSNTIATINSYMKENPNDQVETMVSGKPVLDDSIRTSMKESMQKMMMLSVAFMIIVLSIIFKVSWRLLSLVVIMVAVIGTVGLMGWLNIPITMVSMAVFPILIGLGIDYAIQFHSRYTEELNEGEDSHEQ